MNGTRHKVVIVHTGPVTMEPLLKLLPTHVPDTEALHITDMRLVRGDEDGRRESASRLARYGQFAEQAGASALFIACSAISHITELASADIPLPVVRIDERMARQAVLIGSQIGLLMTSRGTVEPSKRLIFRQAELLGKGIELEAKLCPDAFEANARGDSGEHDRLLAEAARELAARNDVIVLAQASMARAASGMSGIGVPVLASPALGLDHLREVLESRSH